MDMIRASRPSGACSDCAVAALEALNGTQDFIPKNQEIFRGPP